MRRQHRVMGILSVVALVGASAPMFSTPAIADTDQQAEISALKAEIQKLESKVDSLQAQQAAPTIMPSQAALEETTAAADKHDWSGPYAGANVGVGMVNGNVIQEYLGGTEAFSDAIVQGGLHAGYNYQIRNTILGGEAEINLGSQNNKGAMSEESNPESTKSRISWSAALLGRAGIALGDTIFFADAGPGPAIARLRGSAPVNTGLNWTVDRWAPGIKGGAGAEFMVSPKISIRAQYSVLALTSQTDKQVICASCGLERVVWTNMQQAATIGADWHF